MISKISRKVLRQGFPDFPYTNYYRNIYCYPDIYNGYILTVDAKSAVGLCNNISSELVKLMKAFNYDQLLCLGDTSTPWLFRDHDYKPVKKGFKFFD